MIIKYYTAYTMKNVNEFKSIKLKSIFKINVFEVEKAEKTREI